MNKNIKEITGIREAGREKNSFGLSIASIGLPAVTFPSRGTLTSSSYNRKTK
mgnify:CR=1 FL=1